jgi:tetratricopeptide (TPR) repeat protein
MYFWRRKIGMPRRPIQDRPRQGLRRGLGYAGQALPALGLVLLLLLAAFSAGPAQAAKKSYGYEEDPVRLGSTAIEQGLLDEAALKFQEAIDNEWKLDQAHCGLGDVRLRQERYPEAEQLFRTAIRERGESRSGGLYPEADAGLGMTLYRLGQPAEARKECEIALREKNGLWDANYCMARILIDEKQYAEALAYLDKGKDRKGVFKGEDQYHYGLALVDVAQGDAAGAEKEALLALNLNPSKPEYGRLVAEIYTSGKAPLLAIKAYENVLAMPTVVPTAEMHMSLGKLYEGEKRFNDALHNYLAAVEIDSTYAPGFKSSARLYALGAQNDRAAQFYLRYTQIVPDDPEGWYGQAEAFSNLGSNRRAFEAAEKAYALDSLDVRIRLTLARTSYLTSDLPRAERMYGSVADTTLYRSNDWVNLAQIALSQKGFDRADELLTKALNLDPRNPDAFAAKGKLFLSRAKPDSAIVYYGKSLEINPNSLLARINLGVAYLQLKRPADAAQVLRQAVALSPDAAPPHIYLGQAMVMSDSLNAGLAEYKRAMEIDAKSGAALRGAGYIYLKRADYAQAETVLTRATEVDPKNADGWASLGSAQAGLRKIDAGIKSFERALELSPNHEGALRGIEALKKAKAAPGGN